MIVNQKKKKKKKKGGGAARKKNKGKNARRTIGREVDGKAARYNEHAQGYMLSVCDTLHEQATGF